MICVILYVVAVWHLISSKKSRHLHVIRSSCDSRSHVEPCLRCSGYCYCCYSSFMFPNQTNGKDLKNGYILHMCCLQQEACVLSLCIVSLHKPTFLCSIQHHVTHVNAFQSEKYDFPRKISICTWNFLGRITWNSVSEHMVDFYTRVS